MEKDSRPAPLRVVVPVSWDCRAEQCTGLYVYICIKYMLYTHTHTRTTVAKRKPLVEWPARQMPEGKYDVSLKKSLTIVIGASNYCVEDVQRWDKLGTWLGVGQVHTQTEDYQYIVWRDSIDPHPSGCSRNLGMIAHVSAWSGAFWSYLYFLVMCEYERENVRLYIDKEAIKSVMGSCGLFAYRGVDSSSNNELRSERVTTRRSQAKIVGGFCIDVSTSVTVGIPEKRTEDGSIDEGEDLSFLSEYMKNTAGWMRTHGATGGPFKCPGFVFFQYGLPVPVTSGDDDDDDW